MRALKVVRRQGASPLRTQAAWIQSGLSCMSTLDNQVSFRLSMTFVINQTEGLEILILIARNYIRRNIQPGFSGIGGIEFIESFSAVIYVVKGFLGSIIIFLLYLVLKQRRGITAVVFRIANLSNVSGFLAVFSDNGFARFLTLTRKGIISGITKQIIIENWVDLYRSRKFELVDKRIFLEDTCYDLGLEAAKTMDQ